MALWMRLAQRCKRAGRSQRNPSVGCCPSPLCNLVQPLGLWAFQSDERPNNSLKLTRLAGGRGGLVCLPECARMGEAIAEPPGSLARGR
jgi:hypothetical protein